MNFCLNLIGTVELVEIVGFECLVYMNDSSRFELIDFLLLLTCMSLFFLNIFFMGEYIPISLLIMYDSSNWYYIPFPIHLFGISNCLSCC